jgi:ribosomal protein L29
MKIAEFQQKTKDDLQKILDDKKNQVQELKLQLASGKIKSIKDLKEAKKDIARIFTLLNQK